MNINQHYNTSDAAGINNSSQFNLSENNILIEYVLKFKELFESSIVRIKQKISNTKRSSLNNIISELIDNLDNFGTSLSKYEYLKKEYYIYSDIQDMTIYILRRKELIKPDNLEFIKKMLFSFLEVLKCHNDECYTGKYRGLRSNMIEWKRHFFNNICTRSKYYDEELLSEIKNTMLN